MTIQEYMSAEKFPLTTQGDLTPKDQFRIDAINYDQLKTFLEEGGKPTADQKGAWKELQVKIAAQKKFKLKEKKA